MKLGLIRRSFLLMGLAAIVVLFSSQPVQARLSVNPLTIELEAGAGNTATGNFNLENTGQEPIETNIQLVDWRRTPEGGLQFLPPGANDRSCADWLVYSPTSLTLEPGEKSQVSVEVDVPDEAEGDHWAMLLVTEKRRETEDEEPVSARFTVNYAIKILQRDPYTDQKDAKITNIKLTEKNPLGLAVTYKNTGPTHLQTTGTVDIRNIEGETVREFEISEFPTLPGEERIVKVSSPEESEPLTPGTYYAIVVMDFGGDRLIQGGLPLEIEEDGESSASGS